MNKMFLDCKGTVIFPIELQVFLLILSMFFFSLIDFKKRRRFSIRLYLISLPTWLKKNILLTDRNDIVHRSALDDKIRMCECYRIISFRIIFTIKYYVLISILIVLVNAYVYNLVDRYTTAAWQSQPSNYYYPAETNLFNLWTLKKLYKKILNPLLGPIYI